MIDLDTLLRMLGCFLLGSIPFAVLALIGTGIDIRNVGSGNPGFTTYCVSANPAPFSP